MTKLAIYTLLTLLLMSCSSKSPKTDDAATAESENKVATTGESPASEVPVIADASANNAEPEEGQVKEKPEVAKVEEKKEAPREPGSLWSEDSRWNTLYNLQARRRVGDRLFISMSEKLKETITTKLKEAFPDDKDSLAVIEIARLAGTIREITKDGAYKIESEPSVFFAKQERDIKIEGLIREQELGADDSVGANTIAELKVTVSTKEAKKEEAKEGEKEPEKEVKLDQKPGKQVEAARSEPRKETKRKAVAEFETMKKTRQVVKVDKDGKDEKTNN